MPNFYTKQKSPEEKNFHSRDNHEFDSNLIKTFLQWTAPSRPFRKKDRSYYTTIAIIVVLLVLILLLAHEFMLIGAILAASFVAYVLGFVPPEDVEYKISTQGVTIGDHFYFWQDLESFWFAKREGHDILHILTNLRFPGQLMLVLGSQGEEQLKKIVARFLPFHEIAPRSLMDNWAEKLQKHFPLENPHR